MAEENAYREWLKKDLGALIDSLSLVDMQKHFLRSRWLDQVLWMEGKADSARKRYYILRLVAIVGGILVPALISLDVGGWIKAITFFVSLLVAISVAVEEFFHFGERWRHYRRSVELLKIEGWLFFQLSGPYRECKEHAEAYPQFGGKIEEILQYEVDVYISQVVKEKGEEKKQGGGG
jgi:hypothetical protein